MVLQPKMLTGVRREIQAGTNLIDEAVFGRGAWKQGMNIEDAATGWVAGEYHQILTALSVSYLRVHDNSTAVSTSSSS